MFALAAVATLLLAQPLPREAPAEVAVVAVAGVGGAAIAAGLVVELGARLEGDPAVPVSAWSEALRARVVGGVALMGVGLSLLSLAAVIGQHGALRLRVSPWLSSRAGGLLWEVQW